LIALLGWDIAMASYSFCVDAKPGDRSPGRYLFFVFVNPTLTWPARGERVAAPKLSAPGLMRMSQGLAGLFLSGVASTLAADLRSPMTLPPSVEVAAMSIRIASIYLAHTGLASLQIGMMRLLGYVVPERYERVLSARSPVEFWARWNMYVATWARLYVFMPVVRTLRKTLPNRIRELAHGAAILMTFATIGVLTIYTRSPSFTP
jgi:D-alanyl-lipoteichoic acid acyltransferase DltB (MBOAT superfamily)